MKKLLISALVLPLFLSACKSTGVDLSQDAAQTMRDMVKALEAAPAKITDVSTTLRELSNEGGDMMAEYKTFSASVDSLLGHRDGIRGLKENSDATKAAFTAEWEKRLKEIKSESLRKRAEERRTAVLKEFGGVKEIAESAKKEFEPWMQQVVDIRTYLENDLNQGGIDSVSSEIDAITEGASSVNEKITSALSELERIAKSIAATKPPPPPPAEKK